MNDLSCSGSHTKPTGLIASAVAGSKTTAKNGTIAAIENNENIEAKALNTT